MERSYKEVSEDYIRCIQLECRELREKLQKYNDALDRLSAVASERKDDEHGNATSRGAWMEKVVSTALDVLEITGHPTDQQQAVQIPHFVRRLING